MQYSIFNVQLLRHPYPTPFLRLRAITALQKRKTLYLTQCHPSFRDHPPGLCIANRRAHAVPQCRQELKDLFCGAGAENSSYGFSHFFVIVFVIF